MLSVNVHGLKSALTSPHRSLVGKPLVTHDEAVCPEDCYPSRVGGSVQPGTEPRDRLRTSVLRASLRSNLFLKKCELL